MIFCVKKRTTIVSNIENSLGNSVDSLYCTAVFSKQQWNGNVIILSQCMPLPSAEDARPTSGVARDEFSQIDDISVFVNNNMNCP